MNKRIRRKQAKQHASEAPQSASSELHQAVEDLKDSATHLFEIAWSELQQGAVAWVEILRSKANELITSFRPSSAGKPRTNSEQHAQGQRSAV